MTPREQQFARNLLLAKEIGDEIHDIKTTFNSTWEQRREIRAAEEQAKEDTRKILSVIRKTVSHELTNAWSPEDSCDTHELTGIDLDFYRYDTNEEGAFELTITLRHDDHMLHVCKTTAETKYKISEDRLENVLAILRVLAPELSSSAQKPTELGMDTSKKRRKSVSFELVIKAPRNPDFLTDEEIAELPNSNQAPNAD